MFCSKWLLYIKLQNLKENKSSGTLKPVSALQCGTVESKAGHVNLRQQSNYYYNRRRAYIVLLVPSDSIVENIGGGRRVFLSHVECNQRRYLQYRFHFIQPPSKCQEMYSVNSIDSMINIFSMDLKWLLFENHYPNIKV